MGQMLFMLDTWQTEKQIDRACSAQSSDLLPKTPEQKRKLRESQEAVANEKAQYKVPASQWHFAVIS